MSDLISRKKIRDYIKGEINPYGKPFEGTAYELGLKIMRYIDAMESDYDVDKVIEKLEERKALYEKLVDYESKNGTSTEKNQHIKAIDVLNDAIEIVKAGVKNE